MRKKTLLILMSLAFLWTACAEKSLKKSDLVSEQDKIGYAIGYEIGSNLRAQQAPFSLEALYQGVKDAMSENEPLLTPEERQQARDAFETRQRATFAEERSAAAEENEKEGAAFLEENKNREGVTTLPSGLQYQVLREGSGASPKATDRVSVHYIGRFLDGTEFNNSYTGGDPVIFMVNGVIQGWSEALQLMNVGAKWRLWIPYQLGYGEQGAGAMIGPKATLVFEVELLSILE
jgi:FKBP-type peptidyl-prolyl cis-trans isomerase FklB